MNIANIIETALLLLVVFLIGAIAGYWLRRLFFTPGKAPKSGPVAKPATLSTPVKKGNDDLKRIKGIGPKIETELNELGIFHFSQIAQWDGKEATRINSSLNFKGRVQRENWIAQAKKLAGEQSA